MHVKRNLRGWIIVGTWKTSGWMNEANKWNEKMVAVACTIRAVFLGIVQRVFLSHSVFTQLMRIVFVWSARTLSVYSINSGIFICKLFLQPSTFPATSCVYIYTRFAPFCLFLDFSNFCLFLFLAASIFLSNLQFLTFFLIIVLVVVVVVCFCAVAVHILFVKLRWQRLRQS